jgi:hypothetical protein
MRPRPVRARRIVTEAVNGGEPAPRLISWNITLRCPLGVLPLLRGCGKGRSSRRALHAGGTGGHRPVSGCRETSCRALWW